MAVVFVLPSPHEPNVVAQNETLSSRKTIVATSTGGNCEIVTDKWGNIVPTLDV